MSINERARKQLFDRLEQTLGQDEAETLMDYLPPVGWADVARQRDITLFSDEVQRDFQRVDDEFQRVNDEFQRVRDEIKRVRDDVRSDMEKLEYRLIAYIEKSANSQTKVLVFSFAAMLGTLAGGAATLAHFIH